MQTVLPPGLAHHPRRARAARAPVVEAVQREYRACSFPQRQQDPRAARRCDGSLPWFLRQHACSVRIATPLCRARAPRPSPVWRISPRSQLRSVWRRQRRHHGVAFLLRPRAHAPRRASLLAALRGLRPWPCDLARRHPSTRRRQMRAPRSRAPRVDPQQSDGAHVKDPRRR